MATLQAVDIGDLVTATQKELGRMKWSDIASDLQDHIAMSQLLKSEKVEFGSGYEIQWNLMNNHSGAAANVGLYEVDNVNVSDVLTTATIPWRHTTTNYAFERRELAMNREPARIVELIKARRADAMVSLAEKMETNFWSKPTSSTDTTRPFGVPYWLPTPASGSEGFQTTTAGNPWADSNGAASIDVSDGAANGRWAPYGADYAAVTKDDLVKKWRKAFTFTGFKSPVPNPSYDRGSRRFGFYTNYNVLGTLEQMLEAQNDNLGNDLASKDGSTLFRGVPVTWVPYMEDSNFDSDYSSPVFGIDWSVFYPCFLKGEYMREESPEKAANQHTTFQVHIDCTYNFKCVNRRRLFVLDQV